MRTLLIALAAALGLAACVTLPHARRAGSPDRGRVFAERACAGCHEIGGAARSPEAHAPPFWWIATQVDQAELEPILRELSPNGHVEMPPVAMLDSDVRDLAAYISTVQRDRAEPQAFTAMRARPHP